MRLHVIGSGCPVPRAQRYGSAFALELGEELLLVDCGPATTYKMARMDLVLARVEYLFLTHHHFDHNVDLPCLALSRWDLCTGGEPSLKVYGPSPTERYVARLFGPEGAFAPDWRSRVAHPASQEVHRQRGGTLPRPAPRIEACDVGPGPVAERAQIGGHGGAAAGGTPWRVTAARVHHVEPTLESLAYRVDTAEGSVVFAGDCGDCTELRELAAGADVLVVACTHFGDARGAIVDVITGTPGAASIAAEAGVRCVVLTHASPNFEQPGVKDRAIAEVAQTFDGRVVFPEELETVELGEP